MHDEDRAPSNLVGPFYDRAAERAMLRDLLAPGRSELAIIYGRRGVGKSALLQQVLGEAGFRHVYYRATRRTLPLQMAALTEAVREAYPSRFLGQPFASLPIFLEFLAHLAAEREEAGDPEPVPVGVGERPYLADVDPG